MPDDLTPAKAPYFRELYGILDKGLYIAHST